jgi:hypothetical protein
MRYVDKPGEHQMQNKDKDVPLIGSDMSEFWVFKKGGKLERRLSALEVDAGDRSALCSRVTVTTGRGKKPTFGC